MFSFFLTPCFFLINMNETKLIQIFLEEFSRVYDIEEIPSFTIIFENENILSMSYNRVENEKNTNLHSEVLAIQLALEKRKKKFLENTILITTLEPCLMCAGSIILARIREVWYFAEQTKQVGISSLSLETIYKLNHFPKLKFIQDDSIEKRWKDFFQKLRMNSIHKNKR